MSRVSRASQAMSQGISSAVQALTQAIADKLFAIRNGRIFSSDPVLYHLPADDEEISRLDNEHLWIKAVRNGKNYASIVPGVLACRGEVKQILDLGCGTGTWVHEMAEEFPHCEILGVNLLPIQPIPRLRNYSFEVDDINLGLEHFYGQFDMVHIRLIRTGIRDYHALLTEASKVLRPGGLIHVLEAEYVVYDEFKTSISPDEKRATWYTRWIHALTTARHRVLNDVEVAVALRGWLEEGRGHVWADVGSEELWVPVGMWYEKPASKEEQKWNVVGEMTRMDFIASLPATRDYLVTNSGFDPIYIDRLIDKTTAEFVEDEIKLRQQFRLHCAWARKM